MRGIMAAMLAAPLLVATAALPAQAEAAPSDGGLGGVVYLDANGDGERQADEAGVAGITVSYSWASGDVHGKLVTDENGHYEIADLPYGKYSVQVYADGYTNTTPWAVGTAVWGPADSGIDFGIQ
ncbi:SdrD B-like domain-containing protein [Saccharopolyspora sp. NPDC047091]|uniref:SdrD B-like domain-containing protein n=1 Tax=Saccharopolyspora sp. NPDC047091 TaxID=3155924 RepID=UPI0033F53DE6